MSSSQVKEGSITATGTVELGEASGSRVSMWLVHLTDGGSWSGTIQPMGKATGSRGMTGLNLAYKDMVTGDNATAALTGNALILLDGAGLEVELSFTRSAGTMKYWAVPVVG